MERARPAAPAGGAASPDLSRAPTGRRRHRPGSWSWAGDNGLDTFVYLSLRAGSLDDLKQLLEKRATLAEQLAPDLTPEQLVTRLDGSGVRVRNTEPGGGDARSNADDVGVPEGTPPPAERPPERELSRFVTLPTGEVVELYVSRGGVDEQLLASMARESTRAGRRVTALLRMARLERGDRPARRPTDLVSLGQEEVGRAASLAPRLDVTFRASGPTGLVPVDPDGVREALANLLDNARRHALGRISVHLARVAEGTVEFRVADDGPGLPDGDHEQPFEPFVSLDGHGGSGLGLAIARGIARAHGGDVIYEPGAFTLRLPSEEAQAAAGQADEGVRTTPVTGGGPGAQSSSSWR